MLRHRTILLVVCLLINRFCFSQAESNTVFPTILVGKTVTIHSQFEGLPVVEPHLSAHPSDASHLLAAAMVVTAIDRPYESCRLSSFVSKDGGLTWKETAHDFWGYDPWTAILPNGQTAMSWLGTKGSFQHQFPLQFFSSDDGGESWDRSTQSFHSNHGHDGTKITALGRDFYFTTVRFNDDMSADVVLYHRKSNEEFMEAAKVDAQGVRLNYCEPVILGDGSVLVPFSHYLRKVWVQRYHPKTRLLSDKKLISLRPGGERGYMRMLADTESGSMFYDRVYFVRAADGVWLNYSIDHGQTWSQDIRIDQFDNSMTSQSMVASVAVNKEGIVGISWVDSQHDPSQQKNDVYFALSIDGGLSFCPPIRVTDVSTHPKTRKNGDAANKFPGGGHYMNIVSRADSSFQLIWSDSRSGVFELQTCHIAIGSKE